MSKFLYLYRGPAAAMEEMTPEQSAEQMRAWGEWMGRVGPSLTDAGAPFGARSAVADDGTSPRALVDGHPFLSEGKGRFSIEIFELAPMPM